MFNSARDFNNGGSPSIGNWNTSNVNRDSLNGGQLYGMLGVFYQAAAFVQDISGWCVSNIPTKPTSWTGQQNNVAWRQDASKSPQWGTCPAPQVTLTDTDADNYIQNNSVVTFTAVFSAPMSPTATISIGLSLIHI